MLLQKQPLCPYCFQKFASWEIHWRCINPNCDRQGEPDNTYQQYRKLFHQVNTPSAPGAHTFILPPPPVWKQNLGLTPLVKHTQCDACRAPTNVKLCPHCHNEIHFEVGEDDCRIIAIVGSKGSTKSHYIGVLIEQLKRLGARHGFCIGWQGDDTERRYRQNYYEPLFERKRALSATQTDLDNPPMIYQLRFDAAGLAGSRSITLVFFDIAGEIFDEQNTMSLQSRYLSHASALILLMDPLQIGPLRARLESSGYPLPPRHTDPDDILQRATTSLRTYRNLAQSRKIDSPLAVAFTKSDALRDTGILPPGNAVYGQPRHERTFDGNVFRQINEEMQTLLNDLYEGATPLDKRLSQNFAQSAYFCLSPLGEAPAPNGAIANIAPWRVEDPLLWTLHKLGYIKMTVTGDR